MLRRGQTEVHSRMLMEKRSRGSQQPGKSPGLWSSACAPLPDPVCSSSVDFSLFPSSSCAADSTTQSVNKKLGFQDPYDAILPPPPSSLLLLPPSSAPSSLCLHYPDSFFHLPGLLGSRFLTPCGGPSSSLETHRSGRTADSGDTSGNGHHCAHSSQ